MTIFALNQLLQYRQVGRWRDHIVGERAYVTLSLVAKSALAWQVFAGALSRGDDLSSRPWANRNTAG